MLENFALYTCKIKKVKYRSQTLYIYIQATVDPFAQVIVLMAPVVYIYFPNLPM